MYLSRQLNYKEHRFMFICLISYYQYLLMYSASWESGLRLIIDLVKSKILNLRGKYLMLSSYIEKILKTCKVLKENTASNRENMTIRM